MALCASVFSLVLQLFLCLFGDEFTCLTVLPELFHRADHYLTLLPIVRTMKPRRPILDHLYRTIRLELILASFQCMLDHTHRAVVLSASPAADHHLLRGQQAQLAQTVIEGGV